MNGQDADGHSSLPTTPPTNHYDRTAFPLQHLCGFPRLGGPAADQYETIRPPTGNCRVGGTASAPREFMLGEDDGVSAGSELQSAYAELQSAYAIPSELDRNASADVAVQSAYAELKSAYAIPSELNRNVSACRCCPQNIVVMYVCMSCVSIM